MKRFYYIDATATTVVAKDDEDLYEAAKEMLRHFLVIRADAENLPDELLGEVVEATDMFFPNGAEEPLFEVEGYDEPIPMSALSIA